MGCEADRVAVGAAAGHRRRRRRRKRAWCRWRTDPWRVASQGGGGARRRRVRPTRRGTWPAAEGHVEGGSRGVTWESHVHDGWGVMTGYEPWHRGLRVTTGCEPFTAYGRPAGLTRRLGRQLSTRARVPEDELVRRRVGHELACHVGSHGVTWGHMGSHG
eukprot:4717052-Prymnesium_polylepis.1